MRFYTQRHQFTCGIDHARTMYVWILDRDGQTVYHANLSASPEALLQATALSKIWWWRSVHVRMVLGGGLVCGPRPALCPGPRACT